MATALPTEWFDNIRSHFFSTHLEIVKLGEYANIDDRLKGILLRFLDSHPH